MLTSKAVLLTSAFHDQFHTIGWFHLFLGRLSIKWEKAVVAYAARESNIQRPHLWSSQAIHCLWKFARSMWTHRNSIVHGTDAQTSAARILQELQDQVRSLYDDYNANPQIILPSSSHLFTSRTLDQRLRHNYDNINCWLRSVQEAQLDLTHHVRQLQVQSSCYFVPAQFLPHTTQVYDSSSDSYSVSTSNSDDMSITLSMTTASTDTSTDTSILHTYISTMSSSLLVSTTSGVTEPPPIIRWSDDISLSTA